MPVASGVPAQVTWRGFYYGTDNPNATESFKLRFFADSAGSPAASHFYELTALATKSAVGTFFGKTLYEYALLVGGDAALRLRVR